MNDNEVLLPAEGARRLGVRIGPPIGTTQRHGLVILGRAVQDFMESLEVPAARALKRASHKAG
jgi:hypothetical protein